MKKAFAHERYPETEISEVILCYIRNFSIFESKYLR